ncbi:MAG: FAD-binding oxidoreductase, partial [Candidatus Daviesbacteria bacterium]|nr:FAD-binding oxidoreductase [Candidatus Daviesbacteria bacterium]
MIKFVDDFLNGITQYRLMLYFLIFLLVIAVVLSSLGILPFNPIALIFSAIFLVIICWITNKLFAKIFKAPTNFESVYITALILALIMTPAITLQDALVLGGVAALAVASKFILAIRKKHLFNPAAFGVLMAAVVLQSGASWWVGTSWMAPFVLTGGLLIIRKVRRFSMISSYFATTLIAILGFSAFSGNNLLTVIKNLVLDSPALFFAFVMLTEPQTTPPGKIWQMVYGGLVGSLFRLTPETALLVGNIFSYIVSPKEKLLLQLKDKIRIAPDIYDFVFHLDKKLIFLPGQFMEWTLGHKNPDTRGTRRYFTIAASPTEGNLRIGVKFLGAAASSAYPNGSSFKKALANLNPGDSVVASQLSGEFTLPKDLSKKLVFIAGGIGVTPFRSIIKNMIDKNEKRDIVLFYSVKNLADVVYMDIFKEA